MSYLFLALALLAGAIKGFCGKKTSGLVEGYRDAMLVNTVRMLFCILIGFVLSLMQGGIASLALDAQSIGIILLSGISSSVFVVCWLICVKGGAYMMTDVFLMLGTAVPLLGSMLVLGEDMRLRGWLGLCVLILACIIMCSYNNSIKAKLTPLSLALLLLCGIACGFSDFSQKLYVSVIENGSVAAFNFYTYIVSCAVLFICYLVCRGRAKGEEGKKASQVIAPIFFYVLVMAVCLFGNSFFQTLAANGIPAAQLYPLSKSISLMLSSVMAAVFFGEKLTVKCIAGMGIAFVGLLIINL